MEHPQHLQRGRRASGLSLIELLVAIAVVAILATVTLVGVRHVKESARGAVCVGNMRAIGQGFSLFLAENTGRFPGPGPSDPASPNYANRTPFRWMHRIAPYMEVNERGVVWQSIDEGGQVPTYPGAYYEPVFHSPWSEPGRYLKGAQHPRRHPQLGTYGVNTRIVSNQSGQGTWGVRMEDIRYPTRTVLVGERFAGGVASLEPGNAGPPDLDVRGPYPQFVGGPAANAGVFGNPNPDRAGRGMTTFLLADFSVRRVPLEGLQGQWGAMDTDNTQGLRFRP